MSGIYPNKEKIIVIGDLHGDMLQLISILKGAKLIKFKNKKEDVCLNDALYDIKYWSWTGQNTYVVQLGDIFDGKRGIDDTFEDKEVEIYKFLVDLKELAKKDNGNVLMVMGNHELMNFNNRFDYVQENTKYKCLIHTEDSFSYTSKKQSCSLEDRIKLFSIPNGPLAKSMKTYVRGVIKIGPNIFCHAGIRYDIALQIQNKIKNQNIKKSPVKLINELLTQYLSDTLKEQDKPYFSQIYGTDGIVWYRDYIQNNKNPEICNQLEKTLDILNADRMIVGHTVQSDTITEYCTQNKKNKTLWAVDVGLSRAFQKNNKSCAYLEITNNKPIIKSCKIMTEC